MIQINPQFAADRAATLLTIQKLRDEAARIMAEIERLTQTLDGQVDGVDRWDGPSLSDRRLD